MNCFGPAEPEYRADTSVIVVGAGMAGLGAAYHLQRRGIKVTVLEARERIGGRTHTFKHTLGNGQEVRVDLGASWVHGASSGNPLVGLAKKWNIALTSYRTPCPMYDFDGTLVPEKVQRQAEDLFQMMWTELHTIQRSGDPANELMSLQDGVDKVYAKYPKLRPPAGTQLERVFKQRQSGLEQYMAATFAEMSMMHYHDDENYPGGDGLVDGGYCRMVDRLAEGLDIRTSTPVTHIAYADEAEDPLRCVTVTTATGEEISGSHVIVCVPIGVLKTDAIRFDPPLPEEKQEAIRKMGFGTMNKAVMVFPHKFWAGEWDSGQIRHCTDTPLHGRHRWFFDASHRNVEPHVPILVAFNTQQTAVALEQLTDAEMLGELMVILRGIHNRQGIEVPEPVVTHITRWHSEPYSRGSYSFTAVGMTNDEYDTIAEPVGRLQFAGEGSLRKIPGTVTGAYLSGCREADRILLSLGLTGTGVKQP